MKKYLCIMLVLLCSYSVFAIRAGEITYSHISGLTYEITVKIYTDSNYYHYNSIEVYMGDGTMDTLLLSGVNYLFDSSLICKTFINTHTYQGSGTYIIYFIRPNRNGGITNIPNSVNIPFYIESQIIINTFLVPNNSPTFNNPAIDKGFVNNIFNYNPSANDSDGDSLSYKLIVCKRENGLPILGYSFPFTSNLFSLDSITGNLIWDSPIISGDNNIAILVEEWRQGIKIGYVIRETQIQINASNSINENHQEHNNINVFPNPAKDILYIKFNKSTNKNTSIELFDIKGKLLLKQNLNKEQSINIGRIAKGFYVLRLTNDKETFIKKIIIVR